MSSYVPRFRRNVARRGPLKLTTVELPPDVLTRVRMYAAESKLSLRTVFHSAVTEFLERMGAS